MENFEGLYIAEGIAGEETQQASIELKENGQGLLRVLDEEVSFRWRIRGEHIELHTRAGGVIVGNLEGDILSVALAGPKVMLFKKVR